mgnify:CR=1 FL=1
MKIKKILSALIAFILCLAGTVPVNAEASMEEIYDKELETAIISGTGTEDDPYVLDYSKAPMFTEYMVETYESYKQPLTRGSFTSNSLTKYLKTSSTGGTWIYSSGGLSVASDGNLRITRVAYVPNSKLNAINAFMGSANVASMINDIADIANTTSQYLIENISDVLKYYGYTAISGYTVATIAGALATALGATHGVSSMVMLIYAIQTAPLNTARNNGLNYVTINYMTSYHGSWYTNRTSEAGWSNNAIYVPATYLGSGSFHS